MPEESQTKGIFDAAINLVTNKEDKAALEAARQHAAELEQRAITAEAKVKELGDSLAKTQTDLQTAKAYIAQLELRLAVAESKARLYDQAQSQAVTAATAAAQIIEMHVMTDKETLSDLSLKYYGHATKKYWMLIYQANEAAIGPNPNQVHPGTELKIPVLPPDMK
jgi:nucleoid-associated protein YgaU